jgi:hypothetical protein
MAQKVTISGAVTAMKSRPEIACKRAMVQIRT